MNIALLNICSLKNKTQELEKLVNDARIKNNNINFVCLTEHWLKDPEMNCALINNFEIVSNNTRKNFNNGGTLIASSNSNLYKVKERKDLQSFNMEKNFESSAVQVTLNKR